MTEAHTFQIPAASNLKWFLESPLILLTPLLTVGFSYSLFRIQTEYCGLSQLKCLSESRDTDKATDFFGCALSKYFPPLHRVETFHHTVCVVKILLVRITLKKSGHIQELALKLHRKVRDVNFQKGF